jgi:hypothetical protein
MLDQRTEFNVVTEEMEKEGMNQTEIQFFLKACNLGPGVIRKSEDGVEPPPELAQDDDGEQLQPISELEDTEEVRAGSMPPVSSYPHELDPKTFEEISFIKPIPPWTDRCFFCLVLFLTCLCHQ